MSESARRVMVFVSRVCVSLWSRVRGFQNVKNELQIPPQCLLTRRHRTPRTPNCEHRQLDSAGHRGHRYQG